MQQRLNAIGFVPSLVLAGSSGFLVALGAPPNGLLAMNWIGFAPLILIATRDATTVRRAALFGFVGGLGIGLGGFPWIAEMLVKFARVPVPVGWLGLLVFASWMAIPYAIWAAGLRAGPRHGALGWLYGVALFVALQFSWPVLFPYSPFLGFAEKPEFMQFAEVVGVHGVEAVAIAATFFLCRAVLATEATAGFTNLAVWLILPLVLYAAGSARMASLDSQAESARTLRVGIVQPNVGIGSIGAERRLARLREPSRLAEERGAELVVWPEAGVFPFEIKRPFERDSRSSRRRVLKLHATPTVFGAGSRDKDARFGYNSAFFVDEDGIAQGSYDKVNLVPLGEAIPLIDPDWVTDYIPQIAHHEAGEGPARFVLDRDPEAGGDVAFAPLICYEDIIPGYVLDAAAQEGGIELFVNLTIDSWYGDTAEPWEHLALAQFRAIEHRIPIVRSVSTGVSAVIDYNGRLVAHIPLRPVTRANLDENPPEILVEDLALLRNTETDPTIYAQVGWLFPYLCIVGAGAAAMWANPRKRSA